MVFIPSLKKEILPIILKPMHDELFTSWLCRMAIQYNLKPHTFLQNYLEEKAPPLRRDLDLFENDYIEKFIVNHTPFPKNIIRKLFLNDLHLNVFKEYHNKRSHIKNILPLGISNRNQQLNTGIQYCPNCLKNKPYFKTKWRLATSIICLKCFIQLKDKCPQCLSPINFIKIYTSNNTSSVKKLPLNICYKCKFDLSNDNNIVKASTTEITYQKRLNGTIKKGLNSFCNYSFLYIEALLHFASLLGSPRVQNMYRDYILDIKKIDLETNNKYINFWPVEYRRKIFPTVNQFLESAPDYKELKFYKITKSYIDPEGILPFWIYQKFDL